MFTSHGGSKGGRDWGGFQKPEISPFKWFELKLPPPWIHLFREILF